MNLRIPRRSLFELSTTICGVEDGGAPSGGSGGTAVPPAQTTLPLTAPAAAAQPAAPVAAPAAAKPAAPAPAQPDPIAALTNQVSALASLVAKALPQPPAEEIDPKAALATAENALRVAKVATLAKGAHDGTAVARLLGADPALAIDLKSGEFKDPAAATARVSSYMQANAWLSAPVATPPAPAPAAAVVPPPGTPPPAPPAPAGASGQSQATALPSLEQLWTLDMKEVRAIPGLK